MMKQMPHFCCIDDHNGDCLVPPGLNLLAHKKWNSHKRSSSTEVKATNFLTNDAMQAKCLLGRMIIASFLVPEMGQYDVHPLTMTVKYIVLLIAQLHTTYCFFYITSAAAASFYMHSLHSMLMCILFVYLCV